MDTNEFKISRIYENNKFEGFHRVLS